MKKRMNKDQIDYIISKLLDWAKDTLLELKENPNDDFYEGKRLAYYEMLLAIQDDIKTNGTDSKEYGIDIDLEKEIMGLTRAYESVSENSENK